MSVPDEYISKHSGNVAKGETMVNCKWCGTPTSAEFTQECDRCWELHWHIEDNPQVALQMLAQLTPRALDSATALPDENDPRFQMLCAAIFDDDTPSQ